MDKKIFILNSSYIPENYTKVPERFRGLAFRIEDMIQISSTGQVEVISTAPKDPEIINK